MKKLENNLLVIHVFLLLFVTIFSYAYVDLNLTLTKNVLALNILEKLQFLGYYMRPQATLIYITLITTLFANFTLNIILFYKNKLSLKYLKTSTILAFLILIPAYPFLSSDLFNYIFDARIITLYHSNPYIHKPLDYPADEWIRFMRWVHRYSPYGPLWLLYTTIPSILGLGKFVLTLIMFKLSIGIFHVLNSYLIYRILTKTNKNIVLVGTAFYALNPIFLIEGIANAHNDIVHTFFITLTVYFFARSNKASTFMSIIAGCAIKYIAALSVIALAVVKFSKNDPLRAYIYSCFALYALFTYLFSSFRITVPFISSGSLQTQFQPWYLFWTLPLVAFIPTRTSLVLATAVGLSSMLRYLPFLYYGEWSRRGTTEYMQIITVTIPLIVLTVVLAKTIYEKISK